MKPIWLFLKMADLNFIEELKNYKIEILQNI